LENEGVNTPRKWFGLVVRKDIFQMSRERWNAKLNRNYSGNGQRLNSKQAELYQ